MVQITEEQLETQKILLRHKKSAEHIYQETIEELLHKISHYSDHYVVNIPSNNEMETFTCIICEWKLESYKSLIHSTAPNGKEKSESIFNLHIPVCRKIKRISCFEKRVRKLFIERIKKTRH